MLSLIHPQQHDMKANSPCEGAVIRSALHRKELMGKHDLSRIIMHEKKIKLYTGCSKCRRLGGVNGENWLLALVLQHQVQLSCKKVVEKVGVLQEESNDNCLPDGDERNLVLLMEGASTDMVAVQNSIWYVVIISKNGNVLKVRDIFYFYLLTNIPIFHTCLSQLLFL